MKKLNKKGFTLIELLAVIVVLAIIMVIATQQVNATIKKSRRNAFISSYKMILKDIKFKIASNGLGESEPITCSNTNVCASQYDLSASDYSMVLSEESNLKNEKTGRYIFTLTGTGKFNNMELKKDCPVSGACLNDNTIKVYIDNEGKVTAN